MRVKGACIITIWYVWPGKERRTPGQRGKEIDLAKLDKLLPNLDLEYLGKEPPLVEEKPSILSEKRVTDPEFVYIEVSAAQLDTKWFNKGKGFYLAKNITPREMESFIRSSERGSGEPQ